MDKVEKSLFIKCSCGGDIFEIERYQSSYDGDIDTGFNLTFWSYGKQNQQLCWKERIRWCWHILKTGKPWADGIIIDDKKAKEIVDYINKHVK